MSTSPSGDANADDASVLSVQELVSGLNDLVSSTYDDVWVEGELSDFTRAASGHCYFSLTGEDAEIRCVMWRHLTKYVSFAPEDGLQVRAHGHAAVYERRGELQIQVQSMRLAGKGARQEAFERLKRKLRGEGLFDAERKQPLPSMPQTIGIVTSSKGAALRDIVSVVQRRFPPARLVLHPVPVQGMEAPQAIADAITTFNETEGGQRPEVLIVGRGGGSVDDLWAFNEEVVARAIARSSLPVVSAVGHETDVSIADLVADERAATPSMAGEIVVPDRQELESAIRTLVDRMQQTVARRVSEARRHVEHLTRSRAFHRPAHRLDQYRQTIDTLVGRLQHASERLLDRKRSRLEQLRTQLRAADPEAPLRRGYALVERDGEAIHRARTLQPGDAVEIQFQDGEQPARIESSD